jgi:hypothetical protein
MAIRVIKMPIPVIKLHRSGRSSWADPGDQDRASRAL